MFDSPWHWAVVALVAFLLFFGWKQLPDMARSAGRSLRIFKTEIKGMAEDDKKRDEAHDPQQPKALPQAEMVKREPSNDDIAEQPAADASRDRPRPSPRP